MDDDARDDIRRIRRCVEFEESVANLSSLNQQKYATLLNSLNFSEPREVPLGPLLAQVGDATVPQFDKVRSANEID
jgi:hypothetical protein